MDSSTSITSNISMPYDLAAPDVYTSPKPDLTQ